MTDTHAAARALLDACAETRLAIEQLQFTRTPAVYRRIHSAVAAQVAAEARLAKMLPEPPAKQRTPGPLKVRVGSPPRHSGSG